MLLRQREDTVRWSTGLLACAAVLVLGSGAAQAARLVEIDRDTQRVESPPQANADPACSGSLSGFSEGGSAMGGRQGFIEQRLRATVRGTDASCAPAGSIDFAFIVGFTIQPDAGESKGDPVVLCAQMHGSVSAASSPGYSARARLGEFANLANASVINLNGAPIASLGAFDETAATAQDRVRMIVNAAVGDMIELDVRNFAQASGNGVGDAEAFSNAVLRATVGGCVDTEPAPVAAPLGLVGLTAVLGLGGAWALRRRRVSGSRD